MLRGTVFTDRGVYRLGEEVHFKAILRHNTPTAFGCCPRARRCSSPCATARTGVVDERTVKVNAVEQRRVDGDAAAGGLARQLLGSGDPRERPAEAARPEERCGRGRRPARQRIEYVPYEKMVNGSFLVAAYRRPDFRVDVTLDGRSAHRRRRR